MAFLNTSILLVTCIFGCNNSDNKNKRDEEQVIKDIIDNFDAKADNPGVVNFYGVIQYEALKNNTAPIYEIISNAGYKLEKTTYSFSEINDYQKKQLWELESKDNK